MSAVDYLKSLPYADKDAWGCLDAELRRLYDHEHDAEQRYLKRPWLEGQLWTGNNHEIMYTGRVYGQAQETHRDMKPPTW